MKHCILGITILVSSFILFSDNAYPDSSASLNGNELAVHFLDVGQGDCTLVILPGGENVLIDAGGPAEGHNVTKHITSLGITKINHLIFTHPHDDHIGGISDIASEVTIGHFYDNGFNNSDSVIFEDYIKHVRGNPEKYDVLKAGESLVLDSIRIEVLNPLFPPTGNLNEDSVVLKLIFGNINILLPGDLGNRGERRLLVSGASLTSRILKVGHHGDNHSCSNAFLQKVRPEAAIISVDKVNEYGHPHQETLNRLKNAGARIYRTDLNGHIILKTDGITYSIHTEK